MMHSELLKSLFVVSLPRSLSSVIYQASRDCLGLREPIWTSDGELLNADRFVLVPGPHEDLSRKFTTEGSERTIFRKITEFLEQVVVPCGFAYKDVVQPFVVAEWIRENRPPTLKVTRNIGDVAYSMLKHRWHYPGQLYPRARSLEVGVVQGLLRARDALDALPGVEVDFDRLVDNEELLYDALQSLYGADVHIKRASYIDRKFRRRREEILERRSTPEYLAVLEHVDRAMQSYR